MGLRPLSDSKLTAPLHRGQTIEAAEETVAPINLERA